MKKKTVFSAHFQGQSLLYCWVAEDKRTANVKKKNIYIINFLKPYDVVQTQQIPDSIASHFLAMFGSLAAILAKNQIQSSGNDNEAP